MNKWKWNRLSFRIQVHFELKSKKFRLLKGFLKCHMYFSFLHQITKSAAIAFHTISHSWNWQIHTLLQLYWNYFAVLLYSLILQFVDRQITIKTFNGRQNREGGGQSIIKWHSISLRFLDFNCFLPANRHSMEKQ